MKTNTIAISPEAVSFLVGILGNVMDGLCIPDKDRRLAKELYDIFAPLACPHASKQQ